MAWFRRKAEPEPTEPAAVDLVTIDLGLRQEFEVEVVVASMRSDGIELEFFAQNEWAKPGGLIPKHCRLLVHAADEDRVRATLVEAGLL